MRRNAQGDGRKAGADEIAERRIRLPGHHEAERSRPERRRQTPRISIEDRKPLNVLSRGDMHDQRIETRPALGLENPRHRLAVERIRAESIDRLCRKSDETSSADDPRRLFDRLR